MRVRKTGTMRAQRMRVSNMKREWKREEDNEDKGSDEDFKG